MRFERHPLNPIVVPGLYDWRRCITFNPAVVKDDTVYGRMTPPKVRELLYGGKLATEEKGKPA